MTHAISDAERSRIRAQFPALAGDTVFLENAGGSQVPKVVADRIYDYMVSSYVQLGAGYALSQQATQLVDDAHDFVRLVMNGRDGEVILGSSTSALLRMLSGCYAKVLAPGSAIVVAQTGHEANIGPWKDLAGLGFDFRWWEMDPTSFSCSMDRLDELLDEDDESVSCLAIAANASKELGDTEAQEGYMARYQDLNPDDPTTLFNQAAQFLNAMDDEQAWPLLEQCLAVDSEFPQ